MVNWYEWVQDVQDALKWEDMTIASARPERWRRESWHVRPSSPSVWTNHILCSFYFEFSNLSNVQILLVGHVDQVFHKFCGAIPPSLSSHLIPIQFSLHYKGSVQKPQSRKMSVMGVPPLPSPHHGKRPAKKLTEKNHGKGGYPPPHHGQKPWLGFLNTSLILSNIATILGKSVYKKTCIFGHCPNCNLTPPIAQIRALCGTTILPKMRKFFKQQFWLWEWIFWQWLKS